jgi:translation initiation factor IF-2
MSIRLSKITKELNVGLSTVVDFLQKKGHVIESNPNTKISEEQYDILIKEFNKDKSIRIESERISQQRHTKDKPRESVSIEGYNEDAVVVEKPEVKEIEEIKITISEEQRPQIKAVGKINLDDLRKKPSVKVEKKEEKKAVHTEPAPVQQKEVIKQVEEPVKVVHEPKKEKIKAEEPVKEIVVKNEKPVEETEKGATDSDDIFTLRKTSLESNVTVIGKIDLSTINQQTRPKKKTKDEKRKEREDKDRVIAQTKKTTKPVNNTPSEFAKPDLTHSVQNTNNANSQNQPKKKRERIKRERINVPNNNGGANNTAAGETTSNIPKPQKPNINNKSTQTHSNFKKPVKVEVNEEDVQKQVKETLARLTVKKTKGSKYRRDKREAVSQRQQDQAEIERMQEGVLKLTEFVTANELATMMNLSVNDVIITCFNLGIPVSINQRLDAETINFVADEFGFKTEYVSAEVAEAIGEEEVDKEEDLVPRPPIVTVMGHVDHGKTSLLDYIRKANVIAGEAGGITQHIGAYHVTLEDGRKITFLDTPGHEAFTAMRARGAKMTDIAIIIVAADDSVMPQTIEAINHASAAGVPIVFAINKIDKDGANPEKIKEALANMNYLVEEWGGKYQSQDISAKKGLHVKELLEKVLLESELLDLKANPNRRATGSVIESTLDKGRGYVATMLVSNGTLNIGDVVLAGTAHGKVKAMFNERNQRITKVGPGEPVLILGLNGAPQAGDNFNVMSTEHEAREIANKREQLQREQGMRTKKHLTLDELGRRIALGNFQELNIIVKGDVDGSIEALSDSLIKLSTPEIQVNVIHKAVGAVSESDVMLAAASNAIIVGFQVRPSLGVRKIAEKEEIDIRLYSIIYDAIEEIKAAMEGMLSPEIKEEITATIEVREVFKITKVGTVAGCMVREGKVKRSNKVRLIRDGIVVFSGEIDALKRMKEDVKEVGTNYECGVSLKNYQDIKVGDIIESYEETEVKKTL